MRPAAGAVVDLTCASHRTRSGDLNEKCKVRDVMSTPAHTVMGDAGFKEIVGQMEAHAISALPVMWRTEPERQRVVQRDVRTA